MRSKRDLFVTTIFVAAGMWGGPATAQEAVDPVVPEQAQTEDSGVEMITVTARRVRENIQDAPVAVTALSGEQLVEMHPHDLADLNRAAPNFQIQGSGSLFRNSAIAFARGIGYNNIDGTLDPAFGVSINGVPYLRNIGVLQNMFDLQGVEILLGPQGTLYGKNTIAGILNVTTRQPDLDMYEARARLRYGNLGRLDTELVGNVPLSDTFAVRLAYQSQFSEGAFENTYVDPDTNVPSADRNLGGDDTKTVRLSALWRPNDFFDLSLVGTVLRNRSPSVATTNVSAVGSVADTWLGHPGYGQPGGPTDPYVVERSFPSGDWFNLDSITAEAQFHFDSFDLISLTNYTLDETPLIYADFSGAGLVNNYAIVGHEQYSQEFRVQSTTDGPLQWVGGVFYDHGYYDYWQAFTNNIPVALGLATDPTVSNQWIFQWAESVSAFGQVDYDLTDRLQVTVGVRATTETKEALNYANFVSPATRDLSDWPIANIVRGEETWNATTYHIGGKYEFTEDLMGYVSYSTGFHSGGFNSAASAGAAVDPAVTAATFGPWEPEEAKAWEIGMRSEWFDRRLVVNATAFWTEYENLQSFSTYLVNSSTGLTAVGPSNNGNSRARGVELAVTAVPVEGLNLSAAIGYLDVEYTDFVTTRNNLPYDCVALGCVPARSPEWTGRVSAAYDFETDDGTITPSITYSWSSEFYTDTFNNPIGLVEGYGTVDLSLRYEEPSGRWGVSLWGRNVTDERYFLSFLDIPGVATARSFADPATYGIELHIALDQPR